MDDKPLYKSKKAVMGILGVVGILGLALTGNGDPASYGAISLIVSVAVGSQGAADFKRRP